MDQSGVASKGLHFFVGHNQATDGLGEVDQQGGVANVILGDLGLVISELGKILSRVGSKDGETNDSVANHDSSVLDEHRIENTHEESLVEHIVDVSSQLVISFVDVFLFPVSSVVESDFFRVSQQLGVKSSVFSLKLLFNSSQSTERRGDESDNESREGVPREGDDGSLPAYQLSQFAREQNDIQDGFGHIQVHGSKRVSPLFGISGESLVRVHNS